MSLSSHQLARMKSDEWLTPPDIVNALGPFDLDPCCPEKMPWKTASVMLTKATDGMCAQWGGRVWLNPPFSREAEKWVAKLAKHGDGIALVPARTETRMWFEHVWPVAGAVLFLKGRPHFHYVTGERAPANSGAPIALVAYGARNVDALYARAELGHYVELRRSA